MLFFYLIALLTVFIGATLFIFDKKVNWQEWLLGSAISFAFAAIFHVCAIKGMTDDVETHSGQITMAKKFSSWQEYYEYAVYRTEYYTTTETYTDSKGRSHSRTVTHSRQVFAHWAPTSRWHGEYYMSYSNIQTTYDINKDKFLYFVGVFNDNVAVKGTRTTWEHNSRMIGGNPNDYESHDKTGFIEPVTKWVTWTNKVKASPSVFSFRPVPKEAPIYPYPSNTNPFISDRIVGLAAKDFSITALDKLNARLGPSKRVNVILVGFGNKDSSIAQLQQARWIGGKKNDLVICYGTNGDKKASWTYVFGWTEREDCKKNLQTLFLENDLDNKLLDKVEEEVRQNYLIKNWSKFDYLTVEPPTWSYVVYVLLVILIQGGFWFWANTNQFNKN